MNFEKLSESWEELKDLREKATSELKAVTIEKLNFLSDELEKFGMWTEMLIGVVDYFNSGEDNGENDERVVLYWKVKRGYFFKREIFVCDNWLELELADDNKTLKSLEDLRRDNLKMFVKLLPAKIEWLTKSLQQEIVELIVLRDSLK